LFIRLVKLVRHRNETTDLIEPSIASDSLNRQIGLDRFGGPEVLRSIEVGEVPPAAGELRIRHRAIGVNFTDVHGRRGEHRDLHDLPRPLVLGMEAVGVVEESEHPAFKVGDRVAYASRPLGAYCDTRNFPASRCVKVPDGLADAVVAACFLKGITVHVLTRRVFPLIEGMWAVVHSAAGGVGGVAGQWLHARGVRTIGIVGSTSKVPAARESGYEVVLVRGKDDWPARVRELTGGGAPVVYDSVGAATWEGSIACLAPRGHMVCFGNSSGLVAPISINLLRDHGSLSLTWARYGDYVANSTELQQSAQELFDALKQGNVRPKIQRILPLEQAAEAHRLLEEGRTTGSLVLSPEMRSD
jgi:NADPH2:quinone reductase